MQSYFRYGWLWLIALFLLAGCGSRSASADSPVETAAPALPTKSPPLLRPQQQGLLPDRLLIPQIELDIPVVTLGWNAKQNQDGLIFSEWDVAQYAAGWHKDSAYLGEQGNMVMSGHNNIYGAVFRELDQLRRGDKVTVQAEQSQIEYTVDQVLIVPEKYATLEQRKANARWIGSFADDRLTLVSCWPRDDNTHRIIVVAFPNQP
jgi:sortase A